MTSNSRYSMLDSMDIRCARCGYENNPQFRFCGMCGGALRPRDPELRDESRTAQSRIPEVIRTEVRGTEMREIRGETRPEVPAKQVRPPETPSDAREQTRMAEFPMDTDLMSQVLREQNAKPPAEPMPVEPLIAELAAAQKVKADQAARDYSRESREEIHEQEAFHGERTPIPVTGPSFLGLSQSNEEKGFEYLLEDEPHPGRFRTLIGAVLLIALAGVGFHYWQKAGYPGFARATQSSAAKPVTPADSSAEKSSDSNSDAAASPNKIPNAGTEIDKSAAEESNTISLKADADLSAASREKKLPVETRPVQTISDTPVAAPPSLPPTKPSPTRNTEIAKAQPARVRASRSVPAAALPNPAEDSLYLQGQKYLYGGGGVAANCGRAQQYLTTSANNNNSKAQSTLGTMYATGHCVRRDLPLAYRWFARALRGDPRNTRLERDVEIMWNQMSAQERNLALKNQ